MPPRLQAGGRLSQQAYCQCSHAWQPVEAVHNARSRSFHASSRWQKTRLRRDMYLWLDGPGKVFREPLKNSTNYLSAYDKSGKLMRVKRAEAESREEREAAEQKKLGEQEEEQAEEEEENEEEEEANEKEEEEETEDEIVQRELEEGLTDEQREARAEKRSDQRDKRQIADSRERDPLILRESANDLRPYPLNRDFRSQPVLSEELREEVYRLVALRGQEISSVSTRLGIDSRRVAAVVRLKTIEKQWEENGKKLAKPYSQAILEMLPQTHFLPGQKGGANHEPINDLPVHPKTRQQLFYPTSESRQFTREDAAKVFDSSLLPADKRIPHPELIEEEKWVLKDTPSDEIRSRREKRLEKVKEDREKQARRAAELKEKTTRSVPGRRWDFVFQDFSAENVGKDGRARGAIGYRYGAPHPDRKRGLIKIPTSVE